MSSDQDQLHNMLQVSSTIDSYLMQYTDSQWQYINDFNNGDYSNRIQIDCKSLQTKVVCPRDMILAIPLTIESISNADPNPSLTGPLAGTPVGSTAGTDVICFKNSILDLIGNIEIQANDRSDILNEQDTHFRNAIRQGLEHTKDWYESESCELGFAYDSYYTSSIANSSGPFVLPYTVSNADPPVASTFTDRGNKGLYARFLDFNSIFRFSGGKYTGIVFIPLNELHDFYDRMDYPLPNVAWTKYFYINFSSGSTVVPNYPPLCSFRAPTSSSTASTLVAGSDLKITIGGTDADGNSLMGGTCRLYYKNLILPPDNYKALANALKSGYVKKLHFVASDVVPYNLTAAGSTLSSQQQCRISDSVVRPLRVTVLPYIVTSNKATIQKYGSLGINSVNAVLRTCNVDVNDEQYFNKDMYLDLELWNQVRECMVGYGTSNEIGSLLNFHDWKECNRFTIFNLSRIASRLVRPNAQCSLVVRFSNMSTSNNTIAYNYWFVIDRLKTVIIRNGSTAVSYDKFMGNPDTRVGSLGDMNAMRRAYEREHEVAAEQLGE